MEVRKLIDANMRAVVERAAEVMRSGGVMLYPTDTLYGLGADAFSNVAVDTVAGIKGRSPKQAISAVVADMEMAGRYAVVDEKARLLAMHFLPGPLTLVLKKKSGVEGGISREMESIGIRIPDHAFCLALAREFGRPYTTTSANMHGMSSQVSIESVIAQLGDAASSIDLAIDAGDLSPSVGSTVVDLTGSDAVVLREGAIPSSDIFDALRA